MELKEILFEFGGNSAEWIDEGKINGKKVSQEKLLAQAHSAILKWIESKLPKEEPDINSMLEKSWNAYRTEALKNLGITQPECGLPLTQPKPELPEEFTLDTGHPDFPVWDAINKIIQYLKSKQ